MTRRWMPEPGWTGDWELPDLLNAPLSEPQRGALVALALAGMGPGRLSKALADAERIEDVAGSYVRRGRSALAQLEQMGARGIVPTDGEYPAELAAIDAPPPILFVRGERLDRLRPGVAIVGARACTNGAARFAHRLGASFAAAGFSVVSGLARGIDAAAHRGALETGRTIAVLGTGIDVCYPSEHREIADDIASAGALVTEFPPGVGPRAWHFPARNRIIAGLACAVVVVEASLRSGALITAGFALDQGREVFACITGPENPAGAGVREMLLDGARLVVDPEQAVQAVIEVANIQGYAAHLGEAIGDGVGRLDLHGARGAVYEAVTEGTPTDAIVSATGLNVGKVGALLSELELDGLLFCEHGCWYRADVRAGRASS